MTGLQHLTIVASCAATSVVIVATSGVPARLWAAAALTMVVITAGALVVDWARDAWRTRGGGHR